MKKTKPHIPILSTLKLSSMLTHKLAERLCIILILILTCIQTKAQVPYPNTGNQTVCINSTQPYGVVLHAGSTYSWTINPVAGGNGTIIPGATENLITVNWTTAGTANLTVVETNSTGCQGDPFSIVITIVPLPTVTVNSSAICAGTTATIIATPGIAGTYNYTWTVPIGVTNPGNVSSFTSSIAGTYSVIISTSSGCSSSSASGDVTINAAPTLVINNPSVCGSGTVDLTAPSVTAGSTAGLTFTYWTDVAATIQYTTPTAAIAGTYYIKGSLAAGCFAIKAVIVTVSSAPTLIVHNPASICGSGTVDLTSPAITSGSTSGLTFTYWTDAGATISYTTPATATTGTYYIKGSTRGGCFDIKPVVVTANPLPVPIISGPDPLCTSSNGTTSTYSTTNVTGYTYSWTISGGIISNGQNTNLVTVSWTAAGTGSVNLTETITSTGCSANVSKSVIINAKPVTSPITHN